MILGDKIDFLKKSRVTLEGIYDMLTSLPAMHLNELKPEQTAMIIIDLINGFTREGALSSPRVEALIPGIAGLSAECGMRGITKLAFADHHSNESPEFVSYPPHCLAGTSESEMVEELKDIGGYRLITKNSTNGFLEEGFQKWLKQNYGKKSFIVTGDCTDICIQQFAVSLKTWFNIRNEPSRVIVPVNAVDTYDLGLHDGDLLNVVSLFSMWGNGVELVSRIEV